MAETEKDRARLILERKKRSRDWLQNNFWVQWQVVFRNYKAERDAAKDADGQTDLTQTALGMPDTFAIVRRRVARVTAQIPNLRYHAKDSAAADLIGRTLMYQWDKGGVQRLQKLHVLQADLFGWSVRPWYWADETHWRNKRIDPLAENLDQASLAQIAQTYDVPIEQLAQPETGAMMRANLLAEKSRGRLLPVRYQYTSYRGPRCDFLFVGDCYPEPEFRSIQSSAWFIVERRRNRAWIDRVAKRFPELAPGFEELLEKHPKGSARSRSGDQQNLVEMLTSAVGRKREEIGVIDDDAPGWNITEQHAPGDEPKFAYLGEENVYVGEIPYPYDLDGRIAFTELVLIDDLLCGIGDSVARIIRGLQLMHERQVNARFDLIYNLLRPLMGTSNWQLYENAEKWLKRGKGFRLVPMRGPGDLWQQTEQAALAAAAAGLQDESGIMRMLQFASGDSNMSLMANVDPSQNRTATGARIMQANLDVLTKDLIDAFNQSGLKADAETMYLLNRSELPEAIEFDASQYNRGYSAQRDLLREEWVRAEPEIFQTDGEITVEVGSTLADDDEARVAKAMNVWGAAMQRPDQFNLPKCRDEVLIAMGKGRELREYAPPPPPPPPPPEMRASMAVSVKWETLSPEQQAEFLKRAGVQIEIAPPGAPVPGGGSEGFTGERPLIEEPVGDGSVP